jgi:hypothetical protein
MVGVTYVDPLSINYDYAEARANALARMQESYANRDLSGDLNNEVFIINDNKLGKIKLGFKELGGRFSNGVRRIKSLYLHYETVGKRHLH